MGIGATNRIENSGKAYKYQFRGAVVKKDHEMQRNARRKRIGFLKHMHYKAAKCSKCHRGMDWKIAKLQIQNKRENAPICVPCILGIPRRPLEEVIAYNKKHFNN